MKFNLNGLQSVYAETITSNDKSTAFDVVVGKGRFLFMMFLSSEDKDAKDMLFLYLRNTGAMCKLKMYGNHMCGTFDIYIDESTQSKMTQELQLQPGNGDFHFENFLLQLNNCIPSTILSNIKIENLRNNLNIIRTHGLNVVDEADKTIFIGTKHLTKGTPQDKTLRKLYLYTDADTGVIDAFIEILKETNYTVAWTTEDNRHRAVDINTLL